MPSQFATSGQTANNISLVIPAYNEAAVIDQALDEAEAALSERFDDYEIIVVDDGSSDGTSDRVQRRIEEEDRVRIIRHPSNRGYGAALRTGFKAANKELVAFTDADCQFDLRELDRFVLLAKDYDVVCGYRIDRKDRWIRCFYSRGYNILVRSLLGIQVRDVDCALKLFHREIVHQLDIRTNGFLVNSELLTQVTAKGGSLVEVGVTHRPRAAGSSTVSAHHIPKVLASLLRFWWNSMMFPSDQAKLPSANHGQRWGWSGASWIVLVLAACFMLMNLGYPLIDRDETRYAEIPREMLVTGNWLLPQLNFEPYYDKPPLLYWLCALAYRAFGVQEWVARLVPALAAILTLATTISFGSRWFGARVGTLSGIALTLTGGFLFCSRYLLIDGVFTALVTLSWMTAYEAIRRRNLHWGWWIASALSCGLALLAKGPVAWVLWLPPLLAFAWLDESNAKPTARHYAAWILVSFAAAAPWYIAVAVHEPIVLSEFLWTHNLRRFAGAFHAKPLWFFVPVLLIAGHPWSSLSLPLGRFLLSRSARVRSARSSALGLCCLWSFWCFAFFSLSRCKLVTYILPIAPAASLIVAVYLAHLLESPANATDRMEKVWAPRIALGTTAVGAVGLLFYHLLASPSSTTFVIVWMAVWLAILAGCRRLLIRFHSAKSAWTLVTVCNALLGVMVMHQLLPEYSRRQSLLGENARLRTMVNSADKVMTISHEFAEVPFYLDRRDVIHAAAIEPRELETALTQSGRLMIFLPKHIDLNVVRDGLPETASFHILAERSSGSLVNIRPIPMELAKVAGKSPEQSANLRKR